MVLVQTLPLVSCLIKVISLCWPQFVYTQNKRVGDHLNSCFQLGHSVKSNQGSWLAVSDNENRVEWMMEGDGALQKS